MDKIQIKEIDRYTSKIFNRTISEYIIYLLTEDGVKKEAYLEIGELGVKSKISELLKNNFRDKEYIIEKISFKTNPKNGKY